MSDFGEIRKKISRYDLRMILERDICYQALLTHDPRFDGAFFVAVTSTGVYCRTVCTAKTPSLKNCNFYGNAAEAETAGFRPCLRCRPELAPGNSRVDAISRTANVIASMIDDGALNEMSVGELASTLGISERHLRRVVESTFGVSPLELAQTQRLLLAKRLLADSNVSITEVAFASGFSSLRRFNSLLKEKYGLSPSQIRASKRKSKNSESDMIRCQLSYRSPFDWKSLLAFLEYRTAGGVELVRDNKYYRTVRIGKECGWIVVINDAGKSSLQIDASVGLSRVLMPLLNRIRRLFDLNAHPETIAEHLGSLANSNPGLRVPGAFNGFETAVRGILGQQVTVRAASTLMTRFGRKFGEEIETPVEGLEIVFPSAADVAELEAEDLVSLGVIKSRANTIISLARAVASGQLSLEQAIDPEERIQQLKELPGIGDWTAHYIAMRALNWPDAFPYSDLGIRKALKVENDKKVIALAEAWRPWRSYAAMHLWKSLEV